MDRRKFLKVAAITGAGMAIPGGLNRLLPPAEASSVPDLAVVHGASPEQIVRAAVEALGGMGKFVSRGGIVVVKPNIGWDRLPEHAADTNPEVVAAVVKLCIEAGAKQVKVFDRPVNDARRCYVQSGIAAAAGRAGADVSYVDERKFKETALNGTALKTWPLYTEVLDADTVINLPIAKHHSLSRLTLSLKNWMGVMGGSRRQIHQKLEESLVDVARKIRPALTILDAVRILTANGPQGGSIEDVRRLDMVIAGTDQVAIDSYGATLFGMKGSDIGSISRAAELGLGQMDLKKVKIKKINI